MFRTKFAAAVLSLSGFGACATEVVQIAKAPGGQWEVGDKSPTVLTSDGRLGVQLTVKPSPNPGQHFYVVAFHTRNEMPVNFSARVSDRPPQRTHFAARAEPAKPYVWGEHLPAGLPSVYVIYRASR